MLTPSVSNAAVNLVIVNAGGETDYALADEANNPQQQDRNRPL
jgi:hypothetical protein